MTLACGRLPGIVWVAARPNAPQDLGLPRLARVRGMRTMLLKLCDAEVIAVEVLVQDKLHGTSAENTSEAFSIREKDSR